MNRNEEATRYIITMSSHISRNKPELAPPTEMLIVNVVTASSRQPSFEKGGKNVLSPRLRISQLPKMLSKLVERLPAGNARHVASGNITAPHSCKNSAHFVKKEHAYALNKECKRLAVLYPFLTKGQIRSRAKETLSNASKTSFKRRVKATATGKAALNLVNESRTSSTKSRGKDQRLPDAMNEEEEESEFAQKTKSIGKSKLTWQKHDDKDDDDYDNISTDDDNDDPDYHPGSIQKPTPKPAQSKITCTKESKRKQVNKVLEKTSACGFMEFGEKEFKTTDEHAQANKTPSKTKPIMNRLQSFQAQAQTTPAIRMSNKTYTIKDKRKDGFPDKSNQASRNTTEDAPERDEIFAQLINDDSTQQSHVSESPDSTTTANSFRKLGEPLEASCNLVAEQPVSVIKSPKSRTICFLEANNRNKIPEKQSDEERFAKSQKQPPKAFSKFSVENGYEVITLSSDSEDEVTSTVRPAPRNINYLPINLQAIKFEKNTIHLTNPRTSIKEQSKKSLLTRRPGMSNTLPLVTDQKNKTLQEKQQVNVPRGILKHTPQGVGHVLQSITQTQGTVQTPKLVRYTCKKDASTQITPPPAGVQVRVRPLMEDKASAVNMDDEKYSESSSLDSPCLNQNRFHIKQVSSLKRQLSDAMCLINKTMIGKSRQFQSMQTVTPKLCSTQTQTDPTVVKDARNYTSFHHLPFQSMHKPMHNLETPRKCNVSWKEDLVPNMAETNMASALASKRESDHNSFLYSMKLEMELLSEKIKSQNSISLGNTPAVPNSPELHVLAPKSVESAEIIPQNGILDTVGENYLANRWCNIFKSPISPHANLNSKVNKSNQESSVDSQNKVDGILNLDSAKNVDQINKIYDLTAFVPSNITRTYSALSSVENLPTSDCTINGIKVDNLSHEKHRLAPPLLDSQESTETTYSPNSSDEIVSTNEENWEIDSKASSLSNSPLDSGAPKDKLAIMGVTNTPAPTSLPNAKLSLLETLLEKMRRFGPGQSINEKPEHHTLTPKRPLTWTSVIQQNEAQSEPPKKKLKVGNPYIVVQDSLSSNGCSIKQSTQMPTFNSQSEIGTKIEQSNIDKTPKKGDLLCDLFEEAKPKSVGGTLKRYLGYSHLLRPHSVFDNDCSDAFH